ncbi:glycosyltransferase family 2 protein [Lonepinella sp. MS14436]|uniref:glycosyltransferase family 2 protein n=1 Tax=Lonepinella sp. MS14436 TaxID=3003619 RepID=UPI0036DB88EB
MSVQNQTYPCKHYVFVDGKKFWDKVKPLEAKYPDVEFIYLPMNTGGNGMGCLRILAAAPFLINEDIICLLDDDNWYDENHIEGFIPFFEKHNVDYAYHLRHLYDDDGQFICDDNYDSLGFWKIELPTYKAITRNHDFLVDTNCYAIQKNLLLQISYSWIKNDRGLFRKLISISNITGCCTALRTVNYCAHLSIYDPKIGKLTLLPMQLTREISLFWEDYAQSHSKLEWLIPTLFREGQLIPIEKHSE